MKNSPIEIDTWKRQGHSILWDVAGLNSFCRTGQAVSLRQFARLHASGWVGVDALLVRIPEPLFAAGIVHRANAVGLRGAVHGHSEQLRQGIGGRKRAGDVVAFEELGDGERDALAADGVLHIAIVGQALGDARIAEGGGRSSPVRDSSERTPKSCRSVSGATQWSAASNGARSSEVRLR